MGLLDGDLAPVVAAAFGWILLDGELHRRAMVSNGRGGFTGDGFAPPEPIKAMIETATNTMRAADNFNEKDVALLILANGVRQPSVDDEVTVRGGRYHLLAPITMDAAMTHHVARGRLK